MPRISSLNPAVVWIEYADSTFDDHIERITSTITVEVDSLACLKHSNLQVPAEGKLVFCWQKCELADASDILNQCEHDLLRYTVTEFSLLWVHPDYLLLLSSFV